MKIKKKEYIAFIENQINLSVLDHHLHVRADLRDELLLGLAADHLAQLQRGPQGKPHPLLVHLHTVLWNIRKVIDNLVM